MNGVELKDTTSERDIGVIFSVYLKWKNHITKCESKANSILGTVKISFVSFDIKLLRTLYTTFARQLIEFAVPVWSPYLKGDIESFERVQHRVTRVIPSLKKLPYEERIV